MNDDVTRSNNWRQRLTKGSRLIDFDTEKFNFAQVVLDGINKRMAETKLPTIVTLRDIHRLPGITENIETYRQHLFSVFRSDEFQGVFKAFGKHLIDTYFDDQALLQKSPTARIQLPGGGKSVSFHTDGWYGHGETVFSFWLPLVPVSGESSLFMARALEDSVRVIAAIENDEMDLEGINRAAISICDPVEADFGKVLSFSSAMIHGTIVNNSDRCRVSFDFRIAQSVEDLGSKPISNYYTYDELASGQRATQKFGVASASEIKKAWMFAGTCGRASAKSQLIFINEYCKINNINIIGSESEMVTMKHVPVLQSYISNSAGNYDGIILFSVQYLPRKKSTRDEVYRRALQHNVKLVFATEDLVLGSESDIAKVEECLAAYG